MSAIEPADSVALVALTGPLTVSNPVSASVRLPPTVRLPRVAMLLTLLLAPFSTRSPPIVPTPIVPLPVSVPAVRVAPLSLTVPALPSASVPVVALTARLPVTLIAPADSVASVALTGPATVSAPLSDSVRSPPSVTDPSVVMLFFVEVRSNSVPLPASVPRLTTAADASLSVGTLNVPLVALTGPSSVSPTLSPSVTSPAVRLPIVVMLFSVELSTMLLLPAFTSSVATFSASVSPMLPLLSSPSVLTVPVRSTAVAIVTAFATAVPPIPPMFSTSAVKAGSAVPFSRRLPPCTSMEFRLGGGERRQLQRARAAGVK